jgi:hypothetical protein
MLHGTQMANAAQLLESAQGRADWDCDYSLAR